MTSLAPRPLMTLKLDVAFDRMLDFGVGPQGAVGSRRSMAAGSKASG